MRGGGCYYDIALDWYCILFSGLILHPFFWLVKEPVQQICIYNFLPLIVTCILMICFQLLVWWPTSSEEAWPWSPMSSEKDRANMIVLSLHGSVVFLVTVFTDMIWKKWKLKQIIIIASSVLFIFCKEFHTHIWMFMFYLTDLTLMFWPLQGQSVTLSMLVSGM